METRRQDRDILSHQFRGHQGGEREREKDRKRDQGSREIERKTGVGYRDRGSHRERKIGVGGRETGMGERTIE